MSHDRTSALAFVAVLLCVAASLAYTPPQPKGTPIFFEPFATPESLSRWTKSSNSKYNGMAYSVGAPSEYVGIEGDLGLVLEKGAQHYGLSAEFPTAFNPAGQTLVVQYEVQLQNGLDCGGAYVKLIGAKDGYSVDALAPDTRYAIMFGPDRCGTGNDKVHLILQHTSPLDGSVEEKHLFAPSVIVNDPISHLYTLILRPNNTFEVRIDGEVRRQGSVFEEFEPPINPPAEIDDPTDIKPDSWVDEAMIPDPEAVKPEEWDESQPMYIVDATSVKPEGWLDDEPMYVPDPSVTQPAEWDEDMDGEWTAPLMYNPKCEDAPGCGEWTPEVIPNPEYWGPWEAPLIENPAYIGEWKPRQIPNPKYFVDEHPLDLFPIGSIAIEIWTMSKDILFDNFLVTTDEEAAREYGAATWDPKNRVQSAQREAERLAEDGGPGLVELFNNFVTSIKDEPMLIGVTAVAALMPVVAVYFLCSGGSESDDSQRRSPTANDTGAVAEPGPEGAEATTAVVPDGAGDDSQTSQSVAKSRPGKGSSETASSSSSSSSSGAAAPAAATGGKKKARKAD